MSDDRLFSSNNAIGRKWFFLNIIILIIITAVTGFIFDNFIFPDVRSDDYRIISESMLFFLYAVYVVTFLSLVDRRLYDVLGDREKVSYKIITAFVILTVLFNAYCYACGHKLIKVFLIDFNLALAVTVILNFMFMVLVLIVGILRGKISSISFDEYRRRIKYK